MHYCSSDRNLRLFRLSLRNILHMPPNDTSIPDFRQVPTTTTENKLMRPVHAGLRCIQVFLSVFHVLRLFAGCVALWTITIISMACYDGMCCVSSGSCSTYQCGICSSCWSSRGHRTPSCSSHTMHSADVSVSFLPLVPRQA
jgi:hypothetical protein